MVRRHCFCFNLFAFLLLMEFVIFGQETDYKNRNDEDLRKQEYYFAFTEATKYFLFGNYVQAISLYNECLKIIPESGTVHFQLSRIYLNTGNVPMAREYAKKACFLNKSNKWYLRELANIYQMEQKFDSSIVIYKQLLGIDSGDINSTFTLATLYENVGNYDMALDYLDKIDNKIGSSKEVSVNRYRIYEGQKLHDLAITELKKAYVLSDEEYSVAGMIAEFYRDQNQQDSALHYYGKIYPLYKSDPVVGFSYAEFFLKNSSMDTAKNILIEIINDNSIDNMVKAGYFYKVLQNEQTFDLAKPIMDTLTSIYYNKYDNDIRAMAIYADVELRLKNYAKAIVPLIKIVSKDENNYPALEQLVYALNILGKTDSIIYYSNLAIRNFDNNPVFYLFNGAARFQKDDYNQAVNVLEKGLALAQNNDTKLEFYNILAECYERLKQYDKSENAFINALSIDNNNYGLMNNYAYYLALRESDLSSALKMSKKTINAEPNNSTYLDTYAWILFKMKKSGKAEKFILLAMENGGDKNKEILIHYSEILVSLGRTKEALMYLNIAVEIAGESERPEIYQRIKAIE